MNFMLNLKNVSNKNMHVFSIFQTNHRVSTIKRQILPKIFTRCSKKVSAIANVPYKSVCYTEVYLWEFERDSASSLKKCPPLPGVRYIAIDRFDCRQKILELGAAGKGVIP